jgi:protein-disulfide isomerase
MKNLPLLLGTIVGTVLLVVVIAVFFSGDTSQQDEAQVDPQLLVADARLVFGAENPQVTIVEFSDFQCPACQAAQPLVEEIMAAYPDQVQLVYRHFPLDSIHPNARLAAQAVETVHELDTNLEAPITATFKKQVFETRPDWTGFNKSELAEYLGDLAAELGIDKSEFLLKIESDTYKNAVQADATLGNMVGVASTPTFFVDGVQTPAPQLKAAVESKLTDVTQSE